MRMSQTNMKWMRGKILLEWCAAFLLAAATARGTTVGVTPGGWTGDDSDSTRANAVVFCMDTNGAITVLFLAQSGPPNYTVANIIADAGASDSAFSGDYIAAGVKGLSFRIMSDGHSPRYPMVILGSSRSGRLWYNANVKVSAVAGEWVWNSVSFDRAAGWMTDAKGDLDSMWKADLESVGMIGIRLSQRRREAQAYTVGQFRLLDQNGFITDPAVLTPLELALYERFGVKSIDLLTDAQKALDSNTNGMPDVAEILSEHDLGYANSIFAAQVQVDENGITIKWACVKGATYTVFRATNLVSGFSAMPGASDLQAVQTGYMTYKDTAATGTGPYFYKVKRKIIN